MVLSWKRPKLCTLAPEPEETWKKREEVDTPVPVKEEVPVNPECPPKFFGWEDKEFSEDFSENTESPRRSTSTNIISSIWLPKVTSSKIKPSWLSIFISLRVKKLNSLNSKTNRRLEDKRIGKRDKSKPTTKRLEETSNEHEYYIKAIIQLFHFQILLIFF